jgi:hypothetical protein
MRNRSGCGPFVPLLACLLGCPLRTRLGQHVVRTCDPDIKRGKQEDAHNEIGNQASDNDDGKGALRVGADAVRERCG